MDTKHTQYDTEFPTPDPALDALLDQAMQAGTPASDPELAERIYRHTLPMLTPQPVLARIGPTLLRIAAAVAIVAGGAFVLTMMNKPAVTPSQPDTTVAVAPDNTVDQLVPDIQAIASAVEPGNTRIDEQLDVLALRVDWASTESAWGAADQSTSDLIDQAVVRFEMDQLSEESALYSADAMLMF
jgi:hypothetical protein